MAVWALGRTPTETRRSGPICTPDSNPRPRSMDRVSAGELLLWGKDRNLGFGFGTRNR